MIETDVVGSRVRRRDPIQVLALAAPLVIVLVATWVHRFVSDDGYINFRVVNQILDGNGPVFNASERVEAVTSPLWLFVLTAVDAVLLRKVDLGWISVVLGVGFTTAALALSMAGAHELLRLRSPSSEGPARDHRIWPAGALLVVATPPVWWYATAGLEMSLSFLWLAACFWGLATRLRRSQHEGFLRVGRPRWLAVLIGLGCLVRPDFAIYTAAFAAALLLTTRPSGGERTDRPSGGERTDRPSGGERTDRPSGGERTDRPMRATVSALAWMGALPFAYQLFRMGFYASLVPNTALAKSASGSNWSRGWSYLSDLTSTYGLLIPLAAIVVLVAHQVRTARAAEPLATWITLAPVAAAVVHALYVIRIGGDYMHARFFLPALFTLALPVSVIRAPAKQLASHLERDSVCLALVVLGGWALVVGVRGDPIHTDAQLNKTRYPAIGGINMNPITVDDFPLFAEQGRKLARLDEANRDVLVDTTTPQNTAVPLRTGQGIIGYYAGIGVGSVAAGNDIWVVDRHGLADPLASRFAENNGLGIAGHEKLMKFVYAQARFAPPAPTDGPIVKALRRAMGCGEVAELYQATNDPMTPARFVRNIIASPSLTRLEIPVDPFEMERQACGSTSQTGPAGVAGALEPPAASTPSTSVLARSGTATATRSTSPECTAADVFRWWVFSAEARRAHAGPAERAKILDGLASSGAELSRAVPELRPHVEAEIARRRDELGDPPASASPDATGPDTSARQVQAWADEHC